MPNYTFPFDYGNRLQDGTEYAQLDCIAAIGERLEALVEAVDRNTAAIYDTAKLQARAELPGEEFDNAVMNRIGQLERDGYLATAKVLVAGLALIQKARQS